jgi:hypothetical protein
MVDAAAELGIGVVETEWMGGRPSAGSVTAGRSIRTIAQRIRRRQDEPVSVEFGSNHKIGC